MILPETPGVATFPLWLSELMPIEEKQILYSKNSFWTNSAHMADAIYLLQNVTHSILFWKQNFTSGLNHGNGRMIFFSQTQFSMQLHLQRVNLKLMFRFCTLTLEKSSYQTIRLGKNIGLFINVNEKSNKIWQQLVPGVLLNCSPSMTSQIFIILLSFDRIVTISLDSLKMLQL